MTVDPRKARVTQRTHDVKAALGAGHYRRVHTDMLLEVTRVFTNEPTALALLRKAFPDARITADPHHADVLYIRWPPPLIPDPEGKS